MPVHHQIVATILMFVLFAGCGDRDPVAEIRARHAQAAYAETLAPLRNLLEERPEDPELNYLYGVALARTGQSGLSIWALRKASEAEAWAVPAGLELAMGALAVRSYRIAEEAATEVLAREADNLRALRIRGEAKLEDKQDLTGALADFDRILEFAPADFGIHMSRFATLLALERADDAQDALAELESLALEENAPLGERARLCVARAVFAKERKELERANEVFEECLESYPTFPVVLEEAIRFFDERGQGSRATEALQAALQLTPEATPYRRQLANRLRIQGNGSEAEDLLLEGTRLASMQAVTDSWTALAEHYATLDELPKAVDAFERAAALVGPLPQQQVLAYADLLAAAEMNERALEVAKGLDSESYRQLIRARVLLNEQRPREALELYRHALELWPNNAVARYYAARAAEQIGDFEASVEQYRQSIRADVSATDAALRLAHILAAEGESEAARSALSQHLRERPGDPDGTLLAIDLARASGDTNQVRLLYSQLAPSPLRARAASKLAADTAARAGARAAVALLLGDPLLDFTITRDVEGLRSLVVYSIKAGDTASVRRALEAAEANRPEDPNLFEIRGLLLAGEGKALDEVETAYRRALDIDPGNPHALRSLGKLLAATGRPEESISLLCDRAIARVPSEPEPSLRCSEQLVAAGRYPEAVVKLEAALRESPWSAPVALALARIHWNQQDPTRAGKLASHAVRFGGGREARDLLETINEGGPNRS